ncbi:hypothetical protein HYU09_01225 [Candidatus Woesearchaeota archaeon]|nr:hypothetical protein [Candidatus Woesearchaeota archaeon]
MEMKGYKDYILNKSVSVVLTALILLLISLNDNLQAQWRLLIITIIVFGHGHFITSYIYQVRSLRNKLPRKRNILAFVFLLASLSIALLYARFGLGYNDLALVFIGAYFLIHNTLNERTMFVSCSKKEKNSYLVVSIVIFLFLWVYFGSVGHDSFSFALSESIVTFDNINNIIPIDLYENVVPDFVSMLPLFLGVLLLAYFTLKEFRNRKRILAMYSIAAVFIVMGAFSMAGNFLYLMAFIIIYHYITWFIYFLKKTSHGGEFLYRTKPYLGMNILVYCALIAVFYFGNVSTSGIISGIYFVFFSLNYFVLWVFLHITSTLINEEQIAKIMRF